MNKTLFLALATALIIISGCGNGSSSQGTPITDADVRKGTQGLKMEFIKNAPPENVFEGEPDRDIGIFPIGVTMKNNGASDIEGAILNFGFERQYVDVVREGDEQIEAINIEGKSIFNVKGSEEFININARTKRIGDQSEKQKSTVLATACYQYQTVLGDTVCVDTDIFGEELRDKACEVKDAQYSEGQGAPVAITKVETRMLPDAEGDKVTPLFLIYIENRGEGEVINLNNYRKACTKDALKPQDFNRIKITATLSNQELDCSTGIDENEFEVVLREKKDTVRCTLEEGIGRGRDAYAAPLNIVLDYGYTTTISKDITIEKILRN